MNILFFDFLTLITFPVLYIIPLNISKILLKKFYPKNKSKLIKTGSPRVDLWRSTFFDYWGVPNNKPKKPYLLVSSNMGTSNGINSTPEVINIFKDLGYLQRNSKLFKDYFEQIAEDSIKTADFVEAIKHQLIKITNMILFFDHIQ